MRPACKRTALRAPQANSAVNRGALAKDPRREVLAKKNEKDRAILDGGDAPTELQRSARRRDKGGVKFALALSASGKKGMKVAADILQARKKAEAPDALLAREESVNSAVDREAPLGDPRLERESFLRRRRSLDDGGGSSRSLYSSVSGSHRSLHSSIGGSHRSSPAERRNSEYSFREDFISTLLVEQAVERTSQLEEGESCAGSPDVTQSAPPRLGAMLSEMGFGKEQVEGAVEDLNRSGSKVDVDNILGALLGGSCRQVGSLSVGTTPEPDRSDIPDEKIPAKKTNRDAARAEQAGMWDLWVSATRKANVINERRVHYERSWAAGKGDITLFLPKFALHCTHSPASDVAEER